MFLFLLVCSIIVILMVFAIFLAGAFGAAFTIVFSDIIVCIALFAGLGYLIVRKKKK